MTNKKINILLVDNYDSFTFNLKNLVLSLPNISLQVRRNDDDFLPEIERGIYHGAIISPGPGSPVDKAYFGNNRELILSYGRTGFPILGVCLGFQGIYHCFGGNLKLGKVPVHGKISSLSITEHGRLLKGIPDGTRVMRYHSILADTSQTIPECLTITSYAKAEGDQSPNLDEPMSLEHKELPIFGVQFHPESFATQYGSVMIRNFLSACKF